LIHSPGTVDRQPDLRLPPESFVRTARPRTIRSLAAKSGSLSD
jgi:hypothetical protein